MSLALLSIAAWASLCCERAPFPVTPAPRGPSWAWGAGAGCGAQAPEFTVLERGRRGTYLDQGASLCFCIGLQILYRWATREALSHALYRPTPSWFIFNEGRLLPIPVLASTTSHGSAQVRVSSSLLTCLPPPTPAHHSGEFRSPSLGSLSHTENSLVIILHVVVCKLPCHSLHSVFNDLSASVVLPEADGNNYLENKFLLKEEARN